MRKVLKNPVRCDLFIEKETKERLEAMCTRTVRLSDIIRMAIDKYIENVPKDGGPSIPMTVDLDRAFDILFHIKIPMEAKSGDIHRVVISASTVSMITGKSAFSDNKRIMQLASEVLSRKGIVNVLLEDHAEFSAPGGKAISEKTGFILEFHRPIMTKVFVKAIDDAKEEMTKFGSIKQTVLPDFGDDTIVEER